MSKKAAISVVAVIIGIAVLFIIRHQLIGTETLRFYMVIDKNIYYQTIYAEPPQIAVWIKNPQTGQVRNVWVSSRTAQDRWVGRAYCNLSLPYWQSLQKQAAQSDDNPANSAHGSGRDDAADEYGIHAFTMATPDSDFIKAKIKVPRASTWNYYIEVNVSGDFNEHFSYRHPSGYPDMTGNGQPSIIYKGQITALRGQRDYPELIGRTDQWQPVDHIIEDTNTITTAADLLRDVRATCGLFL